MPAWRLHIRRRRYGCRRGGTGNMGRWAPRFLALAGAFCLTSFGNSAAAPWAEVGDAQLRSDIEVLAASGLIDNVTTQWPLPWGGILYRLGQSDALDNQPDYVRAAAERVAQEAEDAIATDRVNYGVTSDVTNLPNVVRG